MPKITYVPITTGAGLSNELRYRHFLLLGGGSRKTQAGTFTIPDGHTGPLSVLTPDLAAPEAVMLFGANLPFMNSASNGGRQHIGFGVANGDQWGAAHAQGYLAANRPRGSHWSDTQIIVVCGQTGALQWAATLDSLDAGPAGFTINVTSPPGALTYIGYLAMEGEGSYACGTVAGATTTGIQSVPVGFDPTAVFLCWGQQTALGAQSAWSRFGYGAGDDIDPSHQYVAWTGMRSNDPHTDNAARWDRVISMLTDVDTAGPFDPTPFSDAALVIPGGGANEFQLNWAFVDGTARLLSWFAVDGDAEVGRISFQHNAATQTDVPTTYRSKGLIFFNNDQGLSRTSNQNGWPGLEHNPPQPCTLGGTLGVGVCDTDCTGQVLNYMQDINRGAGPGGSQQTMRGMDSGKAFGAMRGAELILATNFPRDCGRIVCEEDLWVPQIYRRVIQQ